MARFYYGGQAVIEGVMMRGHREVAVAVRKPDNSIVVRREPLPKHYQFPLFRLPFFRGLVLLSDMLFIGTRMLIFSAETVAAEDDEPVHVSGRSAGAAMVMSLVFSLGIFFVLPLLAVRSVDRFVSSSLVSNLIEGVIRLVLVLGYLALIRRVPDVAKVFAYHGAEHKTINAYEAGRPLDVHNVRPYSLSHPRCGTGFLLIVVVACIFVFAALGRPPLPLRLLSRIVLVPLVASVAYEFVRFAADHYDLLLVRALLAPGMALQRITTREPNDAQLEVAIVALQTVLESERAPEPAPSAGIQTVIPAPALAVRV